MERGIYLPQRRGDVLELAQELSLSSSERDRLLHAWQTAKSYRGTETQAPDHRTSQPIRSDLLATVRATFNPYTAFFTALYLSVAIFVFVPLWLHGYRIDILNIDSNSYLAIPLAGSLFALCRGKTALAYHLG